MEPPIHSLKELFDQLGLNSDSAEIVRFIHDHQLSADVALEAAPFWEEGQRNFFIEARAVDADWVELVDELDTLLHKSSM